MSTALWFEGVGVDVTVTEETLVVGVTRVLGTLEGVDEALAVLWVPCPWSAK